MTLTEFLLARIAEDEAAARPHVGSPGPELAWLSARVLAECEAKRRIVELHYLVESSDWRASTRGQWKRDFPALRLGCNVCDEDDGWTKGTDGCVTLRLMAAVYTDHADFQEDWRA